MDFTPWSTGEPLASKVETHIKSFQMLIAAKQICLNQKFHFGVFQMIRYHMLSTKVVLKKKMFAKL